MHAMNSLFQHGETDAVLLVDASNAFNTLNGAATRHNTTVLCPALPWFLNNTYRAPAQLFESGYYPYALAALFCVYKTFSWVSLIGLWTMWPRSYAFRLT